MQNEFCPHLDNSFYFSESNNKLLLQPCCWVQSPGVEITNRVSIRLSKAITKKIVLQNKESHCNECLKREKFDYNQSLRSWGKKIVPIYAKNNDPYILNFSFENKCNAACTICNSNHSSLWKKELNENFDPGLADRYYDVISSSINFDKVKHIKFAGGEPLLSNNYKKILTLIPTPSNVSIGYATNGSIYPDESLLNLWKNFKNVSIIFSIDGTNKVFDYIRWPLKWEKVSKNLLDYVQLSKQVGNLDIRINFTVNPLNIFDFKNLKQWIEDNLGAAHGIPISLSACFGIWGIDSTPQHIREYAKTQLKNEYELLKLIEAHPEKDGKYIQLVESLNSLDFKRSLSYKDVFKIY